MKLTVVGCSGSFPGPQSSASCYLLQAESDDRTWSILLDLGNGALGPLQRFVDPASLDAVFLSHLHPDHCADLTSLYVTRKYRPGAPPPVSPLPVYGPQQTRERILAMYIDLEPEQLDEHLAVQVMADREPITLGPFRVTPVRVNHPVLAYGLRVEADGKTVAYTGDTDSCPALIDLFTGCDLVLADSAFVEGRDSSRGIHLTGRRAAEAALAAGGVGRLMLTHIPAWNDPEVCRGQAAEVWPGVVELATPGLVVDLGES